MTGGNAREVGGHFEAEERVVFRDVAHRYLCAKVDIEIRKVI